MTRQGRAGRLAPALLVAAALVPAIPFLPAGDLLPAHSAELAGQSVTIRGRVIRADGPVPLEDVRVVLSPPNDTTHTDARGEFAFVGVVADSSLLTASRLGFLTNRLAILVEGPEPQEVEIALEPVAVTLDPIVVSATRDPASVGDVGRAVSVADSTALRRDRTVGLHETLRMMPGVQTASRFGAEEVSIGIRGSGARTRQAVRGVAILLDGVPITEPDGLGRLDLIELAAARQVEVVRGPASALHAGAGGGVVNVVSRSGRDSPGIAGRVQAGAYGFRKTDLRAGGVFSDGRGSALGVATYTTADGYRAHSDGDIMRGHLTLDYEAGSRTRLSFQASGSQLDSRLPGTLNQPEVEADRHAANPGAPVFGFGRVDNRWRAGARVESGAGSTSGSAYFFYGGRTLFFPIPSQIVDLDFTRVQGGARFRSRGIARLPVEFAAGIDYDHVFGRDLRWRNDGGTRGELLEDGRDSYPGLGAHAQLAWSVLDDVTATFGLRYDRVWYRFESQTPGAIPSQQTAFDQASPRFGALWRPNLATTLYASVGRGFETPIVGELSASPGSPIRPVQPKTLWNYEVGGRTIVRERVRLDGAAFLAAVRGEFVPVTVDGQSLPENASRSRTLGLELGVTALATPWLDLEGSYTFLDLVLQEFSTRVFDSAGVREVDFSGKHMPAVPGHRMTGGVRVRPAPALDLGAQLEWQSLVYVETSNALSGIWYFQLQPGAPIQGVPFRALSARALVHLNGSLRLGPATVFASVENLFGTDHIGSLAPNDFLGRFYEPGSPARLTVGLGLAGWESALAPGF